MIVFSVFVCLCLLSVSNIIIANNPVSSVISLILSIIFGSLLLFFLELDFLPFVFIIVYVGAVAILFLFVVMMLNIKPFYYHKLSLLKYSCYLILPMFIFYWVFFKFLTVSLKFLYYSSGSFNQHFNTLINYVSSYSLMNTNEISSINLLNYEIYKLVNHIWLNNIYISNIESLGKSMYTEFFPFVIIAGLILLISMLGSVNLTLPYKRKYTLRKQNIYSQLLRDSRNNIVLLKNYT